MTFGKDIFCHGIEPYNFRDTDETVATITANVGQSTAIGPKVAIRKHKPFPPYTEVVALDMGGGKSSSNFIQNLAPTIACTHGGEPVIGSFKADSTSIHKKSNMQTNTTPKTVNPMFESNLDILRNACQKGIDVVGVMSSLEIQLKLIKDEIMSIDEAITACQDLRKTLEKHDQKILNKAIKKTVEGLESMNEEYKSKSEAIKDNNEDASLKSQISDSDEGEEMCIVRRLTPTETSRLQGFPDDYTKIDGKETADAPQFKAHGNSWATPCANRMNTRIEMELRRLGHEGFIRYATCCSGIEAHSVSVSHLDWKGIFFSEIDPFPCRVLEKHYPTVPNLGDMTQIHFDEEKGVVTNSHKEGETYSLPREFREAPIQELPFKEGDLEVFSGGTPCFTAGHRVLTENGEQEIENIKVGDRVYSHTGNVCAVVRTGSKEVDSLYELVCEDETKFLVTGNHPFMTRKDGALHWCPVEQLDIKTDKLAKWDHVSCNGEFKFQRIKKIENKKQKVIVYNIEVANDHSYVCNGYVVHNCQDVSVAGKRAGMSEESGTRSSLAFHYQRIIDELKPTFTLWEQVPGAFSSNGGADFIWFVNRCAESGYAMAWRVLDAQYVMTEEFPRAVPQRRRRIWMVGYKGNDWRIPARIVFELEKDLTGNPPERVPGLGFKTLSEEGKQMKANPPAKEEAKAEVEEEGLFGLMLDIGSADKDLLKVSKMMDFGEMPNQSDFSKVSIADIYQFAKKIGTPGYIGSVFRTDKKGAKRQKKEEPVFDLFNMGDGGADKEPVPEEPEVEEEWEGAEKISPAILENIGNAGILANGRICTLKCSEWTSGIQLSPATYEAWVELVRHKEYLKANDLLPEAYDETVCGLSDVLQDDPDEKYNLSWRACFGILKRAKTRGKELPAALGIALISTICENAGIVKWVALYGKDTKKKETDLTERENAMMCFNEYIAPVANFEDITPIEPKKKSEDDEAEDAVDDDAEYKEDEDGNPIIPDEGFKGIKADENMANGVKREEMPELPNKVINSGGGEIAATLVSSCAANSGTTQDANVIALKKEERFQE